jgi:HlyD family secretion protein
MTVEKNIAGTIIVLLIAACSNPANENRVVGELASDRIELTAEVSEPITVINVREGATVTAGELLVQQNSDRAIARLAEATAASAQAQARLDELLRGPRSEQISAARANFEGAEFELELRTAEYKRAKELQEKKLAADELLDRTRAALDGAVANLDLRRAQLEEMLAGTTIEELEQAQQVVKQADARRDNAQIDLDRHSIRAPADGVADSRLFEIGERPSPGQAVMILLAGDQPYARVYVPEKMRVKVQPGARANIFVDGLEKAIEGQVRWVSSEAAFTPYFALTERDRGRLSFVAKVDITEQRDRLPDGVPVEVEFLLGGVQ